MIDLDMAVPDAARLSELLNTVIDPEVGIGIVDLGLVYDVAITDEAIVVEMTMTTPACPLGPYLRQAVEQALAESAGRRLVTIELVFDPPWSPDLISEEGRAQLGWSP